MKYRPRIVVCLFVLWAGAAAAQTKTEFEVASIRPAPPDAAGVFVRPGPGGGLTISNMTLKEMITLGWRVQPFQVSGGPPWLDTVHYDVVAKPASKPERAEIPLMVRALLEDRFQLVLHPTTKDLPVYALVVSRKDGKLGPGLTRSKEGNCVAPDPSRPPREIPTPICGWMNVGPRGLTATSVPIGDLTPALSRLLGRTVIDRTGLTGKFDIHVEWSLDETAAAPSDTPPYIFTALQEQLGIKAESQKGPVEILVVERAEKPSAN